MPSKIIATCGVCGIRKQARYAHGYLCGTCKHTLQIQPANTSDLEPGQWTRHGLIWRWQPTPNRNRYLPPEQLVPCGTHAAYHRHKRRQEQIDPECLAAERQYKADWMRRQRAQQRQREAA